MTEALKSTMQSAEKLPGPKKPGSTYAEEAAALQDRQRAEDEKTARLRALRLAKEAADASNAAGNAPSKPGRGKRRTS